MKGVGSAARGRVGGLDASVHAARREGGLFC